MVTCSIINIRILHSDRKVQDQGIPETVVCRILIAVFSAPSLLGRRGPFKTELLHQLAKEWRPRETHHKKIVRGKSETAKT